jgi:sugar lactone lactonase YvrE
VPPCVDLVHLAGKALRKLVMQTRANSVAWNPMEAFNFTAASEDCNLYSYDMRKLASATCVHQVLLVSAHRWH